MAPVCTCNPFPPVCNIIKGNGAAWWGEDKRPRYESSIWRFRCPRGHLGLELLPVNGALSSCYVLSCLNKPAEVCIRHFRLVYPEAAYFNPVCRLLCWVGLGVVGTHQELTTCYPNHPRRVRA